jgi:hypothetical protein
MDVKVAAPAPMTCPNPPSHTVRTGKKLGNQSDEGSERLSRRRAWSELTNQSDPNIVHEAADDGKEQDGLASNAISQGSIWDGKQHG